MLGISLMLALVLACGSEETAIDIRGSVTIYDNKWTDTVQLGAVCRGEDGYSDIKPGGDVVVKTGQGDIVGIGELETGRLITTNECRFPFEVLSVPDADFYEIQVGDQHGSVVLSRAQMQKRHWDFNLELGDR